MSAVTEAEATGAEAPEAEPEAALEPELPVLPLFGKWDLSEVEVEDPTLRKYINLNAFQVPHTGGRHARTRFGKYRMTVVERVINNLMRSERYTGKKAQAYKVLRNSFDIVHAKKKQNPMQVLVRALENSAPRAEVVSLRYGGIRVYSGVDVSPARRLETAIGNICRGAIASAPKQRSIEKALAREIILAAEGNPDSFAVAKKEDKERQAEAAHN